MHCDYCGEEIDEGEEYYELPNHDNIHTDCLSDWAEALLRINIHTDRLGDWAEQFLRSNDSETWGIRP